MKITLTISIPNDKFQEHLSKEKMTCEEFETLAKDTFTELQAEEICDGATASVTVSYE